MTHGRNLRETANFLAIDGAAIFNPDESYPQRMLERIAPRPNQFASHVTFGDSRRIATAFHRKLLFLRRTYRTTMNHSCPSCASKQFMIHFSMDKLKESRFKAFPSYFSLFSYDFAFDNYSII